MLQPLPIFFEAMDESMRHALRIVWELRRRLFIGGLSPLPFAATLRDLRDVLEAVRRNRQAPALFVVNTHGAEHLLREIDEIVGDAPVLFFRRELVWMRDRHAEGGRPGVTAALGEMRPRLTTIRHYGPKNSAQVAGALAPRIRRFLQYGDFHCLENRVRLDASRSGGHLSPMQYR
ncbi:MAG: hypothetical protein KIS92_05580 [Planctomycetota bacterium]|nr:hypothetical protein [Planctomycetota bacterium]